MYDNEKKTISADRRRYHGNNPTCKKIEFCVENGKVSYSAGKHLTADKSDLSNSGNGDYVYHDITPGVYLVGDLVAGNNGARKDVIIVINSNEDNGFDCFDSKYIEEAAEYAGFHYKAEAEAQQKLLEKLNAVASRIALEIENEREEYAEVEINGITAVPEHRASPTRKVIVEQQQKEGFNENEFIVLNGTPSHYPESVRPAPGSTSNPLTCMAI